MKKLLLFLLSLSLILTSCTSAEAVFTNSNATNSFILDAVLGNIEGVTCINKFGRNTDVDTGGTLGRDIWDGGVGGAADWQEPTAPRIHQLTSTDTDDNASGNGARTLTILGLGSTFHEQTEIISLNGTSNVPTTIAYTMIHRMIVNTAGSSGWNEGTITATADSDNTVTSQITPNFNQTQQAIYMVPAGKRAIAMQFWGHLNRKGGGTPFANILAFVKPPGEVWQLKAVGGMTMTGTSSFIHPINPPAIFPSRTLLKLVADPSVSNLDISAGFDLILIDD